MWENRNEAGIGAYSVAMGQSVGRNERIADTEVRATRQEVPLNGLVGTGGASIRVWGYSETEETSEDPAAGWEGFGHNGVPHDDHGLQQEVARDSK